MKLLVIGSGKMGSAIAWNLCLHTEVNTVGLVDAYEPCLKKTAAWINSPKIKTHHIPDGDRDGLMELMQSYDVSVAALPEIRQGNELIEDAITAGINLVDIHAEYHRRPNELYLEGLNIPEGVSPESYGEQLHRRAVEKGIILLGCMGYAPGLSNLTIGHGIAAMDRADTAIARAGGIPAPEVADNYPLKYMVTWCWDQTLDCVLDDTRLVKDGKIQDVPPLSEYEQFRFQHFGKDFQMEAFIAPGMESLVYTRPDLKNCYEKTIRWPGYVDAMASMKACGLFDTAPVSYNQTQIIPKDFCARVMEPKLLAKKQDPDISIMWNTVIGQTHGKPARRDYYMWVDADMKNSITSMGVATGFPAAETAVMMAQGAFSKKGILAPEDAFNDTTYHQLLKNLEPRGIVIEEVIS